MNRPIVVAAVVVVAGIALAACSGNSKPQSGRAQSTSPTSATSTAPDVALRQWGSLIAGLESPVRKAISDYTTACTALDYGSSAPIECTIGPQTIQLTLQTFMLGLDGGAKRLGSPPPELTALVRSTRADSAAVVRASKNTGDVGAREDFRSDLDQLGSDLDAWTPYTS